MRSCWHSTFPAGQGVGLLRPEVSHGVDGVLDHSGNWITQVRKANKLRMAYLNYRLVNIITKKVNRQRQSLPQHAESLETCEGV